MARSIRFVFARSLRRYLWGAGGWKPRWANALGPGNDWAESWKSAITGSDQSVVQFGPLAGVNTRRLSASSPAEAARANITLSHGSPCC